MVARPALRALSLLIAAGGPVAAESPQAQMFPQADACYARSYSSDHLTRHPQQRVTAMAIGLADLQTDARLTLHLTLRLRGPTPAGAFEADAYCENEGDHTLYCAIEGDGGGFQITPANEGRILIEASSDGMGFENDTGFVTLERNAGDDRSFLLAPVACR
jgi:hypothetical protein